jgi:hypothetical protein
MFLILKKNRFLSNPGIKVPIPARHISEDEDERDL